MLRYTVDSGNWTIFVPSKVETFSLNFNHSIFYLLIKHSLFGTKFNPVILKT